MSAAASMNACWLTRPLICARACWGDMPAAAMLESVDCVAGLAGLIASDSCE